jgi:hypothetical protein
MDELFKRFPMKPSVEERIRRLNPDPFPEGIIFRGYFRKPLSWRRAKILMRRGIEPVRFYLKGGREIWDWTRGPYKDRR